MMWRSVFIIFLMQNFAFVWAMENFNFRRCGLSSSAQAELETAWDMIREMEFSYEQMVAQVADFKLRIQRLGGCDRDRRANILDRRLQNFLDNRLKRDIDRVEARLVDNSRYFWDEASYQRLIELKRLRRGPELALSSRERQRFLRLQNVAQQNSLRRSQTCTSFDAREGSPHIAHQYDQGETRWCYAFVASDLMSYRLGVNMSPIDLAIRYMRDYGESTNENMALIEHQEGGYVSRLINFMLEHRSYCTIDRLNPVSTTNMGHIDHWWEVLNQLDAIRSQESGTITMPGLCEILRRPTVMNMASGADIMAIIEAFNRQEGQSLFTQLYQNQCANPHLLPATRIRAHKVFANPMRNNDRIIEALDSQLNRSQIAAISVNINFLKPSSQGSHALLVMGRKFENGQCRYIIKNSWGQDCNIPEQPGLLCENGVLTISEATLRPQLRTMTFLE